MEINDAKEMGQGREGDGRGGGTGLEWVRVTMYLFNWFFELLVMHKTFISK